MMNFPETGNQRGRLPVAGSSVLMLRWGVDGEQQECDGKYQALHTDLIFREVHLSDSRTVPHPPGEVRYRSASDEVTMLKNDVEIKPETPLVIPKEHAV